MLGCKSRKQAENGQACVVSLPSRRRVRTANSNKDKVNDSELLKKINVGYMSTHISNDGASWQCAGKTKRYGNMSISK